MTPYRPLGKDGPDWIPVGTSGNPPLIVMGSEHLISIPDSPHLAT